jgi:hypothetical protein
MSGDDTASRCLLPVRLFAAIITRFIAMGMFTGNR